MTAGRRGYEFFEHTADVGALVRGVTLGRLFENAALAMCDLACDRGTVRPRRRLAIAVRGDGLEDLLVRWLSEILYLQETRRWLFSAFRVARVDRVRCAARGVGLGEPYDEARHPRPREIKAVTYHQLRVIRGRSAWRVRLVFDV